MGTGIVATAGATLPISLPGVSAVTTVAWVLSAAILLTLTVVVPIHWLRHRGTFSSLHRDPVMAQFFGAPPMAFMTVGTATLLVGSRWIGESAAVAIDWALWSVGTVMGLATAIVVPYLLFTRLKVRQDGAFGGWLMPIVPPMVSAASGALLIAHAPAGQVRETLLFGCYALFGMSLVTSLIVITLIWSRLAHFGSSGSARVPTLWIVLGPVGQSITATGALGAVAVLAVAPPMSTALNLFAVLYGVPMWGFMLLWLPIAILLTVRAMRRQMPFALTWWSFTFPVGTCVTGTSQLAKHTGLLMFQWFAAGLYLALLGTWLAVALRTAHGSLRGQLLSPPASGPAIASKG
jgi:C4-dicarboxylate transporter/malic acid transport protein